MHRKSYFLLQSCLKTSYLTDIWPFTKINITGLKVWKGLSNKDLEGTKILHFPTDNKLIQVAHNDVRSQTI